METKTLHQYIQELTTTVTNIAKGEEKKVDDLMQLTNSQAHPQLVADLAEAIGNIVVQNEAKAFRLEMMIQDLLQAQADAEQAKYDSLTGLPNRAMFHELLEELCQKTHHSEGALALMFIDLDKFKHVNDSMGHDAGDEVLSRAGERLRACVGEEAIVARLGGDEFTIILPNLKHATIAQDAAAEITKAMRQPFQLDAGTAHIGASVGVTIFPYEADCPITLLKNADVAMYEAKSKGRDTYQMYKNSKW